MTGREKPVAAPITMVQLAEWGTLLAGITPGPWRPRPSVTNDDIGIEFDGPDSPTAIPLIGEVFAMREAGRSNRAQARADATFIAAAPTVVAALIAEVRRLTTENAALVERAEWAESTIKIITTAKVPA